MLPNFEVVGTPAPRLYSQHSKESMVKLSSAEYVREECERRASFDVAGSPKPKF